jgi:mannose-1-phosphate guanylyltransferase
MKAMALAAGKGTRLFPLTGEIPKPMAPVVNTPIIEHIFDLLAGHGIEEVYVNVHYLADALLEAYGEESRVNGMAVYLRRRLGRRADRRKRRGARGVSQGERCSGHDSPAAGL